MVEAPQGDALISQEARPSPCLVAARLAGETAVDCRLCDKAGRALVRLTAAGYAPRIGGFS
jgi:hypothetical protein